VKFVGELNRLGGAPITHTGRTMHLAADLIGVERSLDLISCEAQGALVVRRRGVFQRVLQRRGEGAFFYAARCDR
ncbi:MAG: hypothetical protein KAJ05_09945, partial [Candidatus Latescibacteria bacterium]|nr:hypothetical protein [Candidatus Latescibacterota bacterium]